MVNDGEFDSNVARVIINVRSINDRPNIVSSPVTDATEGEQYVYDVNATDPDSISLTLTFSLDTAPTGMQIDPSSGLIEWTPANADVGDHSVTVRVTDEGGLFDTQSFVVSVAGVNEPPVITSDAITMIDEDETYTYDV